LIPLTIGQDLFYNNSLLIPRPRVIVRDKNNVIIAKQLTNSQLEDFIDRIQKVTYVSKLFPPDPEEEESMKD
tara:strand:- start:27 stop:242 length:216 start_codon:yes stop_codon:yes gene_type:complete